MRSVINRRTVAWSLAAACAAGTAGATTTVRAPGATCVPKDGRWTEPSYLWVQTAPGTVADGYPPWGSHPWQPLAGAMTYTAGADGVGTLICPVPSAPGAAPETATVVYVYGSDVSPSGVYQARACAGSWTGALACDQWVTNGPASATGWLYLQLNPSSWRSSGSGGFDFIEVDVPSRAGGYVGYLYGYVWSGP